LNLNVASNIVHILFSYQNLYFHINISMWIEMKSYSTWIRFQGWRCAVLCEIDFLLKTCCWLIQLRRLCTWKLVTYKRCHCHYHYCCFFRLLLCIWSKLIFLTFAAFSNRILPWRCRTCDHTWKLETFLFLCSSPFMFKILSKLQSIMVCSDLVECTLSWTIEQIRAINIMENVIGNKNKKILKVNGILFYP